MPNIRRIVPVVLPTLPDSVLAVATLNSPWLSVYQYSIDGVGTRYATSYVGTAPFNGASGSPLRIRKAPDKSKMIISWSNGQLAALNIGVQGGQFGSLSVQSLASTIPFGVRDVDFLFDPSVANPNNVAMVNATSGTTNGFGSNTFEASWFPRSTPVVLNDSFYGTSHSVPTAYNHSGNANFFPNDVFEAFGGTLALAQYYASIGSANNAPRNVYAVTALGPNTVFLAGTNETYSRSINFWPVPPPGQPDTFTTLPLQYDWNGARAQVLSHNGNNYTGLAWKAPQGSVAATATPTCSATNKNKTILAMGHQGGLLAFSVSGGNVIAETTSITNIGTVYDVAFDKRDNLCVAHSIAPFLTVFATAGGSIGAVRPGFGAPSIGFPVSLAYSDVHDILCVGHYGAPFFSSFKMDSGGLAVQLPPPAVNPGSAVVGMTFAL